MTTSSPYRGRLRNKILFMTAFVSLVPLMASAGLALFTISRFHEIDLGTLMATTISEKSDEVDAFLKTTLSVFDIQVGFDEVSDIASQDQYFLLDQLLRFSSALREVSFLDVRGIETSRLVRVHGGRATGTLQNFSLTPEFQSAIGGASYVGDISFEEDSPVVVVASPVRNKNGVIISVLRGEMNLSGLQPLLASARLGKGGYVYLINGDGRAIAHGLNAHLQSSLSKDFSEFAQKTASFSSSSRPVRYRNIFGNEVVAGGMSLPHGWYLIAEWPSSDADMIVRTLRAQFIGVLCVVVLIALLGSLMLANRIVRPISSLGAGASRVAQGKFDTPVDIRTRDEIEELGGAFNSMMKGLKRLEELKEEFVFVAAHELRTPVTAIKGYLSMVEDGEAGPVSDGVRDLVRKVIGANERLIQLVNDLLQVARSDAGRLTVKVEPVDISGAVSLIMGELKPLALQKHISFVYEPQANLPKVMADAQRLKEVFVNLIGNAVKYTLGNGTISVTHAITPHELITHIKDQGVGISSASQARLFEKFYRVQTDKTKDITGTGLGLFIVKQIVEKMHGRIWVESEEGKGSTFSFSLPRGDDASALLPS